MKERSWLLPNHDFTHRGACRHRFAPLQGRYERAPRRWRATEFAKCNVEALVETANFAAARRTSQGYVEEARSPTRRAADLRKWRESRAGPAVPAPWQDRPPQVDAPSRPARRHRSFLTLANRRSRRSPAASRPAENSKSPERPAHSSAGAPLPAGDHGRSGRQRPGRLGFFRTR